MAGRGGLVTHGRSDGRHRPGDTIVSSRPGLGKLYFLTGLVLLVWLEGISLAWTGGYNNHFYLRGRRGNFMGAVAAGAGFYSNRTGTIRRPLGLARALKW